MTVQEEGERGGRQVILNTVNHPVVIGLGARFPPLDNGNEDNNLLPRAVVRSE